jgi:hypothetical protein
MSPWSRVYRIAMTNGELHRAWLAEILVVYTEKYSFLADIGLVARFR